MKKKRKTKITIVGAGISGCFLALQLAKRGFQVAIYEKASLEEVKKNSSKLSFNITFYGYAQHIFQKVGLWKSLLPIVTKLEGIVTHVPYSDYTNFSRFDQQIPYFAVERARLLALLTKKASKENSISFYFQTSVLAIDKQTKTIVVQDTISGKYNKIRCDVILGADGVHSLVRQVLQDGQPTNHIQEIPAWRYKQISFPKEIVEKLHFRPKATYAWTRKDAVIISIPNLDGSHSAIFVTQHDGKNGFVTLTTETKIKQYITKLFPVLMPALPVVTDCLLTNPEGYFTNIYTTPWYYKDFLCLVGDSAHGFFPFYGQGTSAAIADSMEFVRLIDSYGEAWEKIFSMYQKRRKLHTDVLADLSTESFALYRRHKKADYTAIYSRLELLLHRLFPKVFLPPVYVSVTIDPIHAARYGERYKQHQKIQNALGFGFVVSTVTMLIAIQDIIVSILKKVTRRRQYLPTLLKAS